MKIVKAAYVAAFVLILMAGLCAALGLPLAAWKWLFLGGVVLSGAATVVVLGRGLR